MGRVKSLSKFHRTSKNYSSLGYESKERILKPTLNCHKYLCITLCRNGKKELKKIHRLVAEAFLPNHNQYSDINHIDGNKTNNRIDNLEWCTRQHNIKEAYKIGLKKPPYNMLGVKGKNNPSSKRVLQYDLNGNLIKRWDCLIDINKELNYSNNFISRCCKGEYKKAYGYVWRYEVE